MSELKNIILFDTFESFENLLPLSYTRPVGDFRMGITTILEKWKALLPGEYSYKTVEYLQEKFPLRTKAGEKSLYIAGCVLPDETLVDEIVSLKEDEILADSESVIAFYAFDEDFNDIVEKKPSELTNCRITSSGLGHLKYVFDIFLLNYRAIEADYRLLVKGRKSAAPDPSCTIIGPESTPDGYPSIFIEEGAQVSGAILNVKNGPIYIGKDAEVMEGCVLRGPIALGRKSKFKMGAKIYGGTSIGPYCKIGGEIDNIVVFGYSNKAHDGYLGNAVIGEWCNIGAGTNASNLKNDYAKIRIWNYRQQRFMKTDLQFCGLIMGDHSKAGVNCMFNTATVVGVGVNIHGAGFPRVFLPSFSEGSAEAGFSSVGIDKFMTTAQRVMSRRELELTELDRHICQYIHDYASKFKGKA